VNFFTSDFACEGNFVTTTTASMKDFRHFGMLFLGASVAVALQRELIVSGAATRKVASAHSVGFHILILFRGMK
jgi:hypothetical protein